MAPDIDHGRAKFTVSAGGGARYLVVVSSLARQAGSFPFWMIARRVQHEPGGLRDVGEWQPPEVSIASSVGAAKEPVVVGWGRPPERRSFHVLSEAGDASRPQNYRRVEGRLRAVGREVQVYVDRLDLDSVTDETLRDIVKTFDGPVHERAVSLFGAARDVDGDGRFTVLISGALDSLGGGDQAVDGFVRGADLDLDVAAPLGNGCDMMCLNARLESGPHLRTVIAHEYTHAVTFCRKVLEADPGAARADEEGWLDEAVAHLVEDLHGFSRSNLDHRVEAYLAAPERYRLIVDDYYTDSLFRSHGHRGAAYLFLRWCVDQFGPRLLPALVTSKRTGIANLEAATGTRFEELFRRWSVAQYTNALEAARRGSLLPRATRLKPGGRMDRWVAQGTTSHYAILEMDGRGGGAVEVEVIGIPRAEVRVTVVGLPGGVVGE
jgi:hypothetical protein